MNYILLYCKGLFMGFSDIIPGVSGGTIALIVGIYERFIKALKNINLLFIIPFLSFIRFRRKKDLHVAGQEFMRMDPWFMCVLGIGIISGILSGAFVINYLLKNYPAYTYSFFFGLIFASIYLVYRRKVSRIESVPLIFGIFGFIFGLIITGLTQITANHSLIVLFLSGVVAISAMLLPGISGSFILVILGQYRYITGMLHNVFDNLLEIAVFVIGIGIGLISFSRVVTYLFRRYHNATIFFLIGLMAGSLRIIITNILYVNELNPEIMFQWNAVSYMLVGFYICIGFALVYGISLIEAKH
jgi:putative membrane protein